MWGRFHDWAWVQWIKLQRWIKIKRQKLTTVKIVNRIK